jgi:hypothetical protein
MEMQFNYFLSKDASNLAYITFCAFHQRIYLNYTSQFRIFIVPITEYKLPKINLKTTPRFEVTPPGRVDVSYNLRRHKPLPPPHPPITVQTMRTTEGSAVIANSFKQLVYMGKSPTQNLIRCLNYLFLKDSSECCKIVHKLTITSTTTWI